MMPMLCSIFNTQKMKKLFQFINIFVLLIITISPAIIKAQTTYFPPVIGNTWDTISPVSLGWCPDKIDSLLDYIGRNNSKAFILLKDGKIVIEKYYDDFTVDSIWYWASAGKTLTSFMAGIAQQENYLSLSDTTSQYLGQGWTSCSQTQEEKITIWNQLTMTSGLDDSGDPYCTDDTCLTYLADAGTRWAYHNAPYTLLDGVIENATGQTLNNYTTQKLKTPTGMTGFFLQLGYNNVYISTARSMARFGLLIQNHGNWNGNQIMTDTNYFNQMVNTSQSLNNSYGYLWWLNGKSSFMVPGSQIVFPGSLNPSAPNDMIAALGLNGQFINVVPSQNLVYIRMGNAPGQGEVPLFFNDTIWQKLNVAMCSSTSVNSIASNEDKLQIYPNPSFDFCNIELRNEHFDIRISDYLGKIIYERENCFNNFQLSTEKFSNGIYYVRVQNKLKQILYKKLIVGR